MAGGSGAQIEQSREAQTAGFVQLPMPIPVVVAPEPAAPCVQVEILRNGATLRASLPLDSRSAARLRKVTG